MQSCSRCKMIHCYVSQLQQRSKCCAKNTIQECWCFLNGTSLLFWKSARFRDQNLGIVDWNWAVVQLPSVLWRCWLGSRKGIWPVKTEWWGAGLVICLERGADLHMARLMPLPLTVSCFSKIQIGFTFLVPVHLVSPGKRAVKRVCVCDAQDQDTQD